MKTGISYLIGLFLMVMAIGACVKDDYFGKSNLKQILYFNIQGQLGISSIVEDSLKIYVTVPPGTDLTSLAPDSIKLSTFARIEPGVNENQNFSSPVLYTVTAENGSIAVYQVILQLESDQPQLENSGFDDWYTPTGKNYQEPGASASTIWASANAGVTTTGSNNFNTTAELVSGTDYLARLETRDLGALAQVTGQRIGAATLFTGKFVLNIADPPSSAQFGTAFAARPVAFNVDLNYVAGTPYKDGNNQTLNKTDSADIYVLLENRNDPNAIKRVATGWLRVGNSSGNALQTVSVPLTYGTLPSATPVYQLPPNNLYGGNDPVTHISVVFASSANGIVYEGGIGSVLKVNNFSLIY